MIRAENRLTNKKTIFLVKKVKNVNRVTKLPNL